METTTTAPGDKVVQAGMAIDELVSKYGIHAVLAGLASACEIRGEQAWDAWDGPEGLFDPAWERLAAKLTRIARSRDRPKDGAS